jgi:MFS family permease
MFNRSKDWKVYFYATFNSMIDYVVVIFLSLYILVQMNLIEFKGTSLSLGTPDLNIYLYQANISLIICVGIIIGAIIGGQIADKISRRVSVYSSFLLLTVGMLLMLMDVNLVGVGILLLMASIIGFGMGFRHSGYSAVIGEMSKQHPEMDSTYFAVCNSFANLGGPVGLALTGLMFAITGSFAFVFIFMALFQNLSLIFFKMLDPKDYEYKLKEKEK